MDLTDVWKRDQGTRSSNVPVTPRARKAVYVCRVCIQDQSFNNCENDTMKLSVNEAKLTGLCARNCASLCYYSTGFDFKICLRARKATGPFEKWAQARLLSILLLNVIWTFVDHIRIRYTCSIFVFDFCSYNYYLMFVCFCFSFSWTRECQGHSQKTQSCIPKRWCFYK